MSLKLGTTSILGISTVTTNVTPQAEGVVTFYDYDGTVLYTYTTSEFLALSAMPSNPTHTGMIAQGWNWTLSDAQQYVTNWGYLNIGQNYTTSSGATEIFIEIPSDFVDLSFNLRFAVNGTVAISWGDDTAISFVSGTSETLITSASHTYATYGNYCISISLNSGTVYSFYGTSSTNMPTVYGSGASRDYNIAHASTVKEIHCGDTVKLYGYSFMGLYALKSISLSMGTTIVRGQYVFHSLYSLSALIIPSNSNCYLHNDSLYLLYSLKVLSIPNNLKGLGSNVLNGSGYGIDSITLPNTLTTSYQTFTSNQFDQTFTVFIDPYKGIKRINNFNVIITNQSTISVGMFANSFLREITWPVNISSLPNYAFYNCIKLKNVSIPNTVSSIGGYVFYNCYGLTSVTMTDNVTTIGQYVFGQCYSLKSVRLSDSLTQIPYALFSNCYVLENISIPSSVTSIGDSAFSLCYTLQSLTLPTGLLTIGTYVFQQCRSLVNVTIPSTVTSIGNYAFTNCLGMKEYHILATNVPTLGTNVFNNIPSDCKIYVPQASLEAYKTASNWSIYASYMVGE